ncbi:unnamed protein product [Heligmosomoides polygyrus]|uniref:Fungal lipase-type domain-containing protein n=1 Tax=Heligmosomoides polygyrus TaxID=6339 RepID=A0A3P7YZ67_HELPZ|nr:unnamed protein product [Heligmosomoides polygyrus]
MSDKVSTRLVYHCQFSTLPPVAKHPEDIDELDVLTFPYSSADYLKGKCSFMLQAVHSESLRLLRSVFTLQMKRLTSVICDISFVDKCTGYSAVSHDDKAIILSFRGTDRNIQLIMESDETMQKTHTNWSAGGAVSKYFSNGFLKIWKNGMKDDLATLQSQNAGYELWVRNHWPFSGWSNGLTCGFLHRSQQLVTFGQPRTGDKVYAAAVEKEVPYAFRITHAHDIVPHLPLENMEGYYHHKTEAFYNKGMEAGAHYLVCYDMGESTFCSDGNLLDTSAKDHLHYFGQDLSEYGVKGCK